MCGGRSSNAGMLLGFQTTPHNDNLYTPATISFGLGRIYAQGCKLQKQTVKLLAWKAFESRPGSLHHKACVSVYSILLNGERRVRAIEFIPTPAPCSHDPTIPRFHASTRPRSRAPTLPTHAPASQSHAPCSGDRWQRQLYVAAVVVMPQSSTCCACRWMEQRGDVGRTD